MQRQKIFHVLHDLCTSSPIMKKIILDLAVTLDGYIEGPNGEIDWCIVEPDANSGEFLGDLLPDIDTIFYGRISYDLWGNYQPDPNASPAIAKAYRSIHTKTKYVFTTQPRADEDQVIFIQGDIEKKSEPDQTAARKKHLTCV